MKPNKNHILFCASVGMFLATLVGVGIQSVVSDPITIPVFDAQGRQLGSGHYHRTTTESPALPYLVFGLSIMQVWTAWALRKPKQNE